MSPAHEARVPHILQNDADELVPIRCGPASIQAILYGRDSTRFHPPKSAVLKSSVPVATDQETIWTEVKNVSAAIAHALGAASGPSEMEQICEPQASGPPLCWITHPKVMGKLIAEGLATTSLQLKGVIASIVQTIPEIQVPDALSDSLSHGVGAALLIDRMHWVVVYKSAPHGASDLDFHYHDPSTTAPTFWSGVDELLAEIVDIDGHGISETVVVGVRSGTPLAHSLPAPAPAPAPPPPPAISAPPAAIPEAAEAHTFHDLHALEFSATVGESIESVRHVGSQLAGKTATRILKVRHLRKPLGSYYLLEFERLAMVVLDARTHKPRVISSVSEPGQELPTILERDALYGLWVSVDGVDVKLDKHLFTIDEELVWDRCDQSRSMLVPFYVVRPARPHGVKDGRIYVRATDAKAFSQLTRRLRGA